MRLTKPSANLYRKWIDGQHEHGSTRDFLFLAFRRTVEPTMMTAYGQWCGCILALSGWIPHS